MGRIGDVRQGPDGYIYLAIDDSEGAPTRIVRLEPPTRAEIGIAGEDASPPLMVH